MMMQRNKDRIRILKNNRKITKRSNKQKMNQTLNRDESDPRIGERGLDIECVLKCFYHNPALNKRQIKIL